MQNENMNPLGNWPDDTLTCHRLLNVKDQQLVQAMMRIAHLEATVALLNEDNQALRAGEEANNE